MKVASHLAVPVAQTEDIILVTGVLGLCPALGFTTLGLILDCSLRPGLNSLSFPQAGPMLGYLEE